MADDTALADQALAAADELLERFDLADTLAAVPPAKTPLLELLRCVAAAGWVEGRYAGGREAQAVIRRYLERLR